MSDPQLIIDAANGLLKSQAAEIERLKAENKRFREAGHRLEAALDAIDTSLMSEQALAADTKAVGGPVSDYSISYDEQAVVNRVAAEVERLKAANADAKTKNDLLRLGARTSTQFADGMERAAVISENWKHDRGAGMLIAHDIRAEIK